MGVTGLWKLIEPCGKPVPVETLEGKILAVDISIWLHQVVKGFQDNKGSALPNAHLLGLFNRLCKLLYYRVKPVFVFDGCVPQLKRETIARRQQQRSKLNTEAERIQALLLQSLAKEKVVQQALGVNAELLFKSPTKRIMSKGSEQEDANDMFKLPELPSNTKKRETAENHNPSNGCNSNYSQNDSLDESCASSSADDSSSFDESNARHYYNTNLQAIDVKSQYFRDLPADVRHEILVDIKETRKQSSWGRLHELPSRGDDFSVFQMKRLLKRRAVQESLEEAEQEMGGKTLTYAELTNIFTEEGILEANILERGSKQICSDEHTRFLLVRDLKKKLSKAEEKDPTEEKEVKPHSPKRKMSTDTVTVVKEPAEEKKLGKEFDTDLQLALAISLEETQVYNENDYQYESNEELKLNRAQRTRLQNAATGPARAYMIEYGGMNEEEVEGIMEKTQTIESPEISFENSHVDVAMENNGHNKSESEEIRLHMSDDSDTDGDLEEVPDPNDATKDFVKSSKLEIVVDLTENPTEDDDIFADCFESNAEKNDTKMTDELKVESKRFKKIEECREDIKSEKKTLLDSAESQSALERKVTTKTDADSILSNLKAQLDDVKNIKLDDIKIESSIIELSDEEIANNSTPSIFPKTPIKTEFIEICDSDDGLPLPTLKSKSPNLKTPKKNGSILEYYNVNYVVKRTPDKPPEDEDLTSNRVVSPFFVKKTPKSSDKRRVNEDSSEPSTPKKEVCKASKSLFENETAGLVSQMEMEGVKKLETASLDTEELIKEAADKLKEQKSEEELQNIASDLARERKNLESERNRQDRMGMSITQRMNSECQELLRLFGIPYIVAPMEAEAQCAFLDFNSLTNGTITDDSDIWLFGGRTVYKNFFAQNKHVLEFRAEKIENTFNCDRNKLIQLACLVGSDYTTGVHGIGAVTALEILASFTTSESTKQCQKMSEENMRDILNSVLATLTRFRDWWVAHKATVASTGTSARLALRKKLKNIELHDSFPSLAVVEAYLRPRVDESRDTFSWGYPDVESIREYAKKTFGWTTTKTNEILTPVLKRLNEKTSQATIRNYFAVKSALSVRDLKVSKRVQKAIDKMSGVAESETLEKPKRIKANRTTRIKKKTETNKEEVQSAMDVETLPKSEGSTTEDLLLEQPTTSKMATRKTRKRGAVNLHNKNSEVIPQREKDKEKMLENKAKAADMLKELKIETATKKKRR